MLLSEIKLPVRQSPIRISNAITSNKTDIIGSGWQTVVYAHKKHANSVIKIASIDDAGDPIYQSLRVFFNHQNNPFFPKIYNYKVYPSRDVTDDEMDHLETFADIKEIGPPKDSPYKLVIVTERLQPIESISQNEILAMMESLGILQDVKNSPRTYIEHRSQMMSMFRFPETRGYMRQNTTNKDFANALRLLEPLFRKFAPDMHFNNVMLRGRQLVIIDPVGYIGSDILRGEAD